MSLCISPPPMRATATPGTTPCGRIRASSRPAAPIFPSLVANTPRRLGAERAAHLIGFQVGAASLGIAFLPALAGVLAEQHGLETIPPLLVLSALVMLLLHEAIVARSP